jgi:hypothetical protein
MTKSNVALLLAVLLYMEIYVAEIIRSRNIRNVVA